ncbi:MAG: hypothetical protein Q4D02_00125 [Clostridia bacterium]|nr:hypothetical protein [Clostridia bacterium]
MDEGALTKALYVGVSLFVTVITITAIIAYYNIARESIKEVGSGIDFDVLYREDVKETLLASGVNNQITGTQVKNLVSYYYDNFDVEITILGMKYVSEDGTIQKYDTISLSSTDRVTRTRNYNIIMKHIIGNQHFTLERNINDSEKMIVTIKGE